jgi:hypothetical protein
MHLCWKKVGVRFDCVGMRNDHGQYVWFGWGGWIVVQSTMAWGYKEKETIMSSYGITPFKHHGHNLYLTLCESKCMKTKKWFIMITSSKKTF